MAISRSRARSTWSAAPAQPGGLALCLREIFDLPVVLGTGDRSRHPSDELDGLLESGLVMSAADGRREHLATRSGSLRKRASGVWTWLTHALT